MYMYKLWDEHRSVAIMHVIFADDAVLFSKTGEGLQNQLEGLKN